MGSRCSECSDVRIGLRLAGVSIRLPSACNSTHGIIMVKVIESTLTDATAIDVESELDITMFHHGPSLDSITLLEASLVSFAREVNVANVSEAIVSFCVPGSARNPRERSTGNPSRPRDAEQ